MCGQSKLTSGDYGGPSGGDGSMAGDRLREWVRADFGVDLSSVELTRLGADETAELWHGAGPDGARFAVKLSGGAAPAGLALSAHLAARGVAGVVGPAPARDGRLYSVREGLRLSIVPWLSDHGALDSPVSAAQWTAYGALLAAVHATEVTGALAEMLPREDHSHDRIAAVVRAVDNDVAGRMAGSAGDSEVAGRMAGSAGAADAADPLARALAELWRGTAGSVAALLAQADCLGRELRARPDAAMVICHGDPHLGNLLLGAGQQVWLIDWDDAVLAPPERDLMFAIGGVLAFAPVSREQQAWFFDGYGPAEPDPDRLAYYRCVRALDDLGSWAAAVLDLGGHSQPERANALAIVRGMLSPTGLVTLALSSPRDLGLYQA